ncbi:hypothetical protein C5745_18850 [Sphingobacterium haloxyli]|uniref:Peptidase S74 domain-containing protein n=2 Tax=Sphingobacterium haloxyli TaxID=2100533 RepID=A0A2S9IWR0_9SPHI|nr:hypothetical protein C5745_18850 [Sphingobacterium haloxyli]
MPRQFSGKLQFSFVSANQGFPSFGTVLMGGAYSVVQDGGVFQLYFPYSAQYGGVAPQVRLGKYNNQGWTDWHSFFTSANANNETSDWKAKKLIVYGNIGIGTETPSERLAVNGNIRAKEIKVEATNWPDYVFRNDFELKPLSEVERYINENGHLPEIPTASEVEIAGVSLGEMNKLLLKKVEELTLHLIEKEKQVRNLEQGMRTMEDRISKLETKN